MLTWDFKPAVVRGKRTDKGKIKWLLYDTGVFDILLSCKPLLHLHWTWRKDHSGFQSRDQCDEEQVTFLECADLFHLGIRCLCLFATGWRKKKIDWLSGKVDLRPPLQGKPQTPRLLGSPIRSAFLVSKKSLFLQKCQCIELLTVFLGC